MFKQWIIGLIMEAVRELIESGRVAEWLDMLKAEILKWVEPQLRAVAAQSENDLDDKLVDIIIAFMRK
ncbi:MAG: hypothetical protein ACXABY_32045 [Candidatus Thorarchaeota archaeon]|jgi:TorA maturation chaperone TorD